MNTITIREKSQIDANTYQAELCFNDDIPYQIEIKNPFAEAKQEELLEWYFEEYSKFPFMKQVEFAEAAASIDTYGEVLFEQVFGQRKAYTEYSNALQTGDLKLEIIGSPAFHQVHWEALKDSDSDHALALHYSMIRKPVVEQHPQPMAKGKESATLNVLLVTARPDGKHDVGYRTISRPLVEMLQNAKLPVKIDILRPGTYQALVKQLEQVTNEYGKGYYHLLHFDVHGAVLNYEELEAGRKVEQFKFSYQARFGREDLQPFEGLKAFLFLQGDKQGQAEPLEATELSNLLAHHGVPLVMLNACQSAKQVGSVGETSLGSRLMQSGVQTVVAMAYSVKVSAAKIFMQTLYENLFQQVKLNAALRLARLALFNDKTRIAHHNQQINLEDWLLPVVYQRQVVDLPLRELTVDEEVAYWQNEALRYEAPSTQFGFVGRDLDVLEVENRLLSQRNILLICGMGGTGKTTLLHHLGAWWQTTHFVKRVFYFGYDVKAWNRQQILLALATELLPNSEVFKAMSKNESAQQKMIVKKLRSERHLLILDNLESITGSHLAILHTLSEDEQQELQSLLNGLVGGESLVLLGSRGEEKWLAAGTFENNVYGLAGLDAEADSQLVDLILAAHGVSHYREAEEHREYLQSLLKLLAGYPLALQVVLGNLVRQTPKEVLEALEAGVSEGLNTGVETGNIHQDKTTNILRCIDYSYGNLSEDAQKLLLCLAPFTGVVRKDLFPQYTEKLQQQPLLAGLPFEQWESVLQQAKKWGLLEQHSEQPIFLTVQPIFPYFMRNRLQSKPDYQAAIETAFRQYYDEIGDALKDLLQSKQNKEKRMGRMLVSFEYENLCKALNFALVAQVSILNFYYTLSLYLDTTKDYARGLVLGKDVLSSLEKYPDETLQGQLGAEFVGLVDGIATKQCFLKKYAEAEQSYQKALSIWLTNTGYNADEIKQKSASIYHQLGVVAKEQRQWQTAKQYYQKALAIYIEFNDKSSQAGAYHNLGVLAQGQHQWSEAEHYYQNSLAIKIEFNDKYEQARTYHHLGMVAQEQHQWQIAEHYYQKALIIFLEFNDKLLQAHSYHNLGEMAREQKQWQAAEQYYQKALEIKIEFSDKYEQADTYQQLGILAEEQKQWQQAKDYFLKALNLFFEFNDSHSIETLSLPALARLYQATNDNTLPTAVAEVLGIGVEEVLERFGV
ncbi:tetratricopeptide repeat protein [Thiotrichales bacterium HSG1]|nr:tetratricopeptide repeat protein [Thiotrichales bacterium HSG1]